MEKKYRKLTKTEKSIIDKLLERDFSGRRELKRQISSSLVRIISEYQDNSGSLEFKVGRATRANVTNRIPVFGQATDLDGNLVEIFLHVIDGKIDELEIVKAGKSPLMSPLNPNNIKVITDQEIIHQD